MAADLVALGLLAICALLGAWRGAWASATALAALAAGGAASVAGAFALGPGVAAALGIPVWVGSAAAGSGSFLVTALAIGLAGRAARRAADARRGGAARSPLDRCAGALLGAARGAVLVLLLGVTTIWLDAARELAAPDPAPEPAADTPLRSLTRAALEGIAGAAGGQEANGAGVLAARVLAHPAESLGALRRVAEHPALAALADDPGFWGEIEAGRPDFALARPSFQALAGDGALRRDLATIGALDPAAAGDAARFRAALRPVLVELGPRLAALRRDPELLALAGDPTLADALARRDVLALLAHPAFQRALARTLSPPAPRG
ncbi:MAG: CvpA family protein [Deltaproteobacteria bacterium]|nr:CvpA family protein [Deltaproteobacteria bacterium]